MHSRLLALTPFISLAVAAFVACGSRTTTSKPIGSSGSASGAAGGSGAPGSGMTGMISGSSTTGSAGSGTATSGASMTGSAGSGTTSSGATSGTSSSSSSDANTDTGPMSSHPVLRSAGCGTPAPVATGTWVRQPANCDQNTVDPTAETNCQAIPPGTTPVHRPASTQPEWRGWWVQLPSTYDPNIAYRVIYNGTGCGDADWFNAGADGLKYQNFDNNDAILVGLDYDTYSDLLGCYDHRNPTSNDFQFFPWLQATIESEFCVDINHEFFSGWASGASVAQQFNCAFPDKLRGTIAVSGCEPGAPGYPGSQPPCVSKPTAAFYAKDLGDTFETYACILPACERVLTQNGCMVNGAVPKCDPQDKTITSPYPIPASLANVVNTAKVNLNCVQFNGCPTDYPVVFCMYTDASNRSGDTQDWGGPALYWDWMSNQLAD